MFFLITFGLTVAVGLLMLFALAKGFLPEAVGEGQQGVNHQSLFLCPGE